MPNYIAHSAINLVAGSTGVYAALIHSTIDPTYAMAAGASFSFATFFLSPDLDLNYSNPTRNWGPLKIIWRGYSSIFKHRGISHSLFFSTISRLLYLGLVVGLILLLAHAIGTWWTSGSVAGAMDAGRISENLLLFKAADQVDAKLMIAILTGILLSDICHIMADKLASAGKALLR